MITFKLSAILLVATVSVSAQWLHYPTAGLPRTSDGKVDLAAPTPRTKDGKVDFSGLWLPANDKFEPTGGPHREFTDVSKGVEGGLPLQPWAADLVKARAAQNSKDDPDGYCQPLGTVKMHLHPYPRKMVQTPGLLLILFERNTEFRQIFTDGRPLPEDPQPSFNGYSTARYEGDTLLVETVGFRDGMWADILGTPLTGAAKVTERFRRPSFGKLEIDVTVDDAKAYTKPWTLKLHQTIAADTDMLEFVCLENEKDDAHLVGK